jgi:hypothetical protein
MAYYIYKRGRKGRCSFLCCRWPTYKRPRVSVLFFLSSLPHFLFLVLFFSCSSSSTCVLLLLQAMFSITVNTGRANNSVRAFRLEKDILFHSYMPNIRALSWPLKCYLTGRYDGARRGLERNLWTSESMGRKKQNQKKKRHKREEMRRIKRIPNKLLSVFIFSALTSCTALEKKGHHHLDGSARREDRNQTDRPTDPLPYISPSSKHLMYTQSMALAL